MKERCHRAELHLMRCSAEEYGLCSTPRTPEVTMRIELTQDEATTLRDLLQEKVRELDTEINRTDSLRFKGELRELERHVEHILGSVTMAMSRGPDTWEPRDAVTDLDKR
jgi:hypothetical protein